jgi:hypothetical protein
MPAYLQQPPFDRERLDRVHAMLRRHAAEAPPSGDALTDEIRRQLASGRIRGRDLLRIDAYRDHLRVSADQLIEEYRGLSNEQRRELRRRSHGPEADAGPNSPCR